MDDLIASETQGAAVTKCKPTVSQYGEADGLANAIIVVESFEIPIVKEILSMGSPVFRKMFTGSFKEAQSGKVELPGKSLDTILWLLDHLYPAITLRLNEAKAIALLPLAHEYDISSLKIVCSTELRKKIKTRLEIVTLAEMCHVPDLLHEFIQRCGRSLSLADIDKQRQLPENKYLTDTPMAAIYRLKVELFGGVVKKTSEGLGEMYIAPVYDYLAPTRYSDITKKKVGGGKDYSGCDSSKCSGSKTKAEFQNDARKLAETITQECPRF